MIEATALTKKFEDIVALDAVSATIRDGSVFGLIGTNGAGKSTFLRLAAGVYRPDGGYIRLDGEDVFERPEVKAEIFLIPDEPFFFANATPLEMIHSCCGYYRNFDRERCRRLLKEFGLDERRKINTFSKGMKKQVSLLLALAAGTRYILCDETFDGLDPVMRQAVKSLFASEMAARGLTPVLASHNLRELEDICDHVGLLHRGGILLSRDIDDMKLDIHKIQFVLQEDAEAEVLSSLNLVTKEQRGRLWTIIVRGDEQQIRASMQAANPVFYEMIPLSLEEIFITETEVAGYDIKKLIVGE